MMPTIADLAASLGLPVFPCEEHKRPLVARWPEVATTDSPDIRRMFGAPAATMIGVPTGRKSGLVVIDVDVKNGAQGRAWLDANTEALPQTRTHRTRSGGLHLVFRAPEVEIRNSASRVAPGVDVRGEGGYVIWPGSPGYAVGDTTEPAEMPRWLIRACLPPETPQPLPRPAVDPHARYVQAAIDGEIAAVIRAGEGTRNTTLHAAAIKLGTIVGAGGMSRADAEAELLRAGQVAGLASREVLATLKSGLDFGIANPRELPERREPRHAPEPPRDDPADDPGYWDSVITEAADAVEPHPVADPDEDAFPATPLTEAELLDIPPRELVYGHFLFRKFISAIGAPGGAGKTAYAFALALAIATGRDLLGEGVHDSGPVWIYNLEDPRLELLRRMRAVLLGHDLTWRDIEGRVFLDSGRDRPLVIARALSDGTVIAWPQVPALIAEIKRLGVRVLIVDPFVRSHRVEENVNDQVDFVAALWSTIADHADCAILLVHHFRKGGISGEASAFRGASALIDASRSAVTLATMSADEAKSYAIEEKNRWRYVRADNAKLNLAPPPDQALWLELTGVDLDNATPERQADHVQTVHRWSPPSAFEDLPLSTVIAILTTLSQGPGDGEQYGLNPNSGDRWAGHVVMRHASKNEGQAKRILAAWKANGVIENVSYHSPSKRKDIGGMMVNMDRVAEMAR